MIGLESCGRPKGPAEISSSPTLVSTASNSTSLETQCEISECATPQGSSQPVDGPILRPHNPGSIASAVKSRKARTPARALSKVRWGKIPKQTLTPAAHRADAGDNPQRKVSWRSLQVPKAASARADLCLPREGRPKPAQDLSDLDHQAAPQGSLKEDEHRAGTLSVALQVCDLLLRQQAGACQHSMLELPVSTQGPERLEIQLQGIAPLYTSSPSHCSIQLSADKIGREPWDQVCLRIPWLCHPLAHSCLRAYPLHDG